MVRGDSVALAGTSEVRENLLSYLSAHGTWLYNYNQIRILVLVLLSHNDS